MSEDFATYIRRVRENIADGRHKLDEQMNALKAELAQIEREEAAINAYEAAKAGKPAPANTDARQRARRGSRRQEILAAVQASPIGLSRGDLIEMLGTKGDKSHEMSLSNALTVLTKTNQLVREGGKYRAPAQELQQAAE
jgi:hypothetical protein